jgi:hypothetical protein
MTRTIYRFDAIEWHVPTGPGTDVDAARAAGERGVGRKFLAQGDGGFYAEIVRFPAGFEAPAHSHDHAEVFVVLDGSCAFDGIAMQRHDSTVVAADEPYGFVAGDAGLTFLIVRTAPAAFRAEEGAP